MKRETGEVLRIARENGNVILNRARTKAMRMKLNPKGRVTTISMTFSILLASSLIFGLAAAKSAPKSTSKSTSKSAAKSSAKKDGTKSAATSAPKGRAKQTAPASEPSDPWWKHAVFYEVYPRSFADSNNDGIGDLNGITSKLDYLHDLGIDAIWITPCFPSPQVDFGYDVSNYTDIDPMYGTLKDFDKLVKEAKKRNIRIILDFVINHSSDQHPWFQDSKSSKTAAKRDWYVWRDGKDGGPPNNWQSIFGGPAWTLDPATGQYYYHFFYPQQPDLNWRNPAVEKAMFDATRFWYKRGVAGFRLDAVNALFEDPKLTDNPILPGKNSYGDPNMKNQYNSELPENHEVLRRLRAVADQSNAVLIGETWTTDTEELKLYYGANNDEIQLPMDFLFTMVNKMSAPDFRKQVQAVEDTGQWPVFVISNHDIVRSWVRYGDGTHNDQIAKVLAGMYLTLRGTPIMYYGEELGMQNTDPKTRDEVKDPIGKLGWPQEKGRDGERTPMQWNSSTNAGFSKATPWLPVADNFQTRNVEAELKVPDSVLNFYRTVLKLRKSEAALKYGDFTAVNIDDPNVFSYIRTYKGEAVLVALNMSAQPQTVKFDLKAQGFAKSALTTLASSGAAATSLSAVKMQPFSAYIGKVTTSTSPANPTKTAKASKK
jgi:alpha-glucosidase